MGKKESKQETDERANSIALAIKVLNQKIAEIEEEGEGTAEVKINGEEMSLPFKN